LRRTLGDMRPALRFSLSLAISGAVAMAQSNTMALPNMGQTLSPVGTLQQLNPGLKDHPDWTATHAVTSVVSPLGGTMLVMTSGFNRIYNNPLTVEPLLASWSYADSAEYVFVYDITTSTPTLKQVIPITLPVTPVRPGNTYSGIVFDPTGLAFYVPGGPDDVIHIFTLSASTGTWVEALGSLLDLGHGRWEDWA
jgi:hypothetical protein